MQTTPGVRQLGATELSLLLALLRGGNLAAAAQLAGVDTSTVFRTVQRAERALGQRLFERSRAGYRATELGQRLGEHAERIEAELEAARSAAQVRETAVSGLVRVSTTDTLLNGLLLPALPALRAAHPQLRLEINARNELANLTQREADVALRATVRPPPHLVGRHLGPIRSAVCIARALAPRRRAVDRGGRCAARASVGALAAQAPGTGRTGAAAEQRASSLRRRAPRARRGHRAALPDRGVRGRDDADAGARRVRVTAVAADAP